MLALAAMLAVTLPASADAKEVTTLGCGAACRQPTAQADTPREDEHSAARQLFHQRLASAYAMSKDGQHAGALRAFNVAIADPLFDTLDAIDQQKALSAAGWAALKIGDTQRGGVP